METKICFLDKTRDCTYKCMAFGKDGDCSLLINIGRSAQQLEKIGKQLDWMVTAKQDELRTSQPAPPGVR